MKHVNRDYSELLIDGPWSHEFVSANGSRFHVALAGPQDRTAPLVVLLHSFPQFWWAWRHQIPALAEAGYRVAAIDMRGTGASDKPPHGYDIATRTRDVAGVIRSLGASKATIIGHGLGGTTAWAMATLQPAVTKAVAALGAPHPARLHTSLASAITRRALGTLTYLRLPVVPERMIVKKEFTSRIFKDWGGQQFDDQVLETYLNALRVPFGAHNSLEQLRWFAKPLPSAIGRRYLLAVRSPISVPALQIHGSHDGLFRVEAASTDSSALCLNLRYEVIGDAGHFLAEEKPELINSILLDWLGTHCATS